ncbi:MAG: hypothetical protein ACREDR_32555, partial [Blastocatellia bacterium]
LSVGTVPTTTLSASSVIDDPACPRGATGMMARSSDWTGFYAHRIGCWKIDSESASNTARLQVDL